MPGPDPDPDPPETDGGRDAEGVAIVVIGRNEALRLHDVLVRATSTGLPVIYVDSASTDESRSIAEALGVHVIVLDTSSPLSAARARNAGADHFATCGSPARYIQFIDGDCLIEDGWINAAVTALDDDPLLGAVCGWRRESEPRKNVFHEIVDMEWKMGRVGLVDDFAGDVMIRLDAFEVAGGYDPAVMAGEDTEFSARLRAAGFTIHRLDLCSTVHDINMTSVRQWWRRSVRSGLGYGIVAAGHRHTDQLFLGKAKRAALWGFVVPAVAVLALSKTKLPALAYLARMGISSWRAARSIEPERAPLRQRLLWGVSCTTSDLPAAVGLAQFASLRLRRQAPTLVEYKRVDE